jgi:hypothetical protein
MSTRPPPTDRQTEVGVRGLLVGMRFHQLTDPNPKTVADVTSTWTIPTAGKDELIFHNDGSYVFTGNAHFLEGHELTRMGRGQFCLRQQVVQLGEWIALRMAQLHGGDPTEFVGRRLWRVDISGPDLWQYGEAMDMDDVNECGVQTVFSSDDDGGGGGAASEGGGGGGAGGGSERGSGRGSKEHPRKRITSMSWWVDDVLSWTTQQWVSPEEQRERDELRRNPKFQGLGKGFLNRHQAQQQPRADAGGGGGGGGGEALQFTAFASGDGGRTGGSATIDDGGSGGESQSLRARRISPLPPLVPERSDLGRARVREERPPHTCCGTRVEDWWIYTMALVTLGTVLWNILR